MPPNNTDQQPTQNPQPQQPVPLSTLPAQPLPQQPIVQADGSQPKKSNKKLIIGIIIGVFVLFVLPIILLIIFLTISALQGGGAQTAKASSAFMTAMTKGDVTTALTYTDGSSESKQFLEGMAPGVKASSFEKKDSTQKSEKWYYLYTLEGATNNTARTELEKDKDSGKWYISGFYSGDNLALVAAGSTDDGATPASDSGQCLVQSDFDNWYKNNGGLGKTATEYGFKFHDPTYMFTNNVHFPADSLDYKSTDNTGGVEVMANLANDPSVKGKQFAIHLYGGVGTSQADSDFANKRAEVVKEDLIAAGVPADKIVIDPPQSATDYESNPDEVSKGMTRVVVLKFDPTCSS